MKQVQLNRPKGIEIAFYSMNPNNHDELKAFFKKRGDRIRINQSLIYFEKSDIVLIEANFPYFRIFKFLKLLQQAQSTACVLMMGPELDSGKVSALLRGGVFDYLKTPFPYHRLLKTMRKGLKNRENLLNILNLSSQLEEANQSLSGERDQLKKWNTDLSALYELNQTLSESLHIEEIVKSLFTNIQKVVPHDISCLYLKGWDQVRVEADLKVWGDILEQVKDETREDALKLIENHSTVPQATVCHGGSEIMVLLSVGASKIGLLRLMRMSYRHSENTITRVTVSPRKSYGSFSEYQAKLLSMISVPLAISIRNAEMYKQVEDLSIKDPLTDILNRRSFSGILEREFRRANRYNTSLTIMVIDLDHFKKVNDTYGHLTGDQVLCETASIFKSSIRDIDVLIRYGGEEFVVILPGTNLEEGLIVANRIKKKVERKKICTDDLEIPITVSIGIAHYPSSDIQTPECLFNAADQALYRAKKTGRNCIVSAKEEESISRKPDVLILGERRVG